MDIVIISEFCDDFSLSDNDRFLYLAKMLSHDNDVEIITSSFRHTKKEHRRSPNYQWSFKITFIEEPGYPKNICFKRFSSHYIWGKNVINYLKTRNKPDVVYCAIPSLTCPNLVGSYCNKKGIRFVIDVQDLWPEAFRMVFNIPFISTLVFLPFNLIANRAYSYADSIVGVSETYSNRALQSNRKCTKATTVYLGTDLSIFDEYALEKPIIEKNEREIWLGYCGTLGSSYDLSCVFDALELLNDANVKMIIMGDGPLINDFKTIVSKKKLNCVFTGRLPYKQMCSLLSICDIAINPISHMASQSIINKHADYAAAGIPVVSTQESEEYKKLVDDYEMGFNCSNNNALELSDRIRCLISNDLLRDMMGKNARRCARDCFDRKTSYKKLAMIIE